MLNILIFKVSNKISASEMTLLQKSVIFAFYTEGAKFHNKKLKSLCQF
jgi:hypothetical protein